MNSLAVAFGIAGLVFGLWRYQKEKHWYSRWHAERTAHAASKVQALREAAQRAPDQSTHTWLREEAVLVEHGLEQRGDVEDTLTGLMEKHDE